MPVNMPVAFGDVLRARIAPRDVRRIPLRVYGDGEAVYHELAVLNLNRPGELAVHGIVPQHIYHVFEVDKRVVDSYNLYVWVIGGRAEDHPAYAAKSIDANFYHKENLHLIISQIF